MFTIFDSIKPIQTTKLLTMTLDPTAVQETVKNFGEAHLPSTLMHYHSPVLPVKLVSKHI